MNQTRITLIIAMIFFGSMATFSAWYDLQNDQNVLKNINFVESRLSNIAQINSVISNLQKERGLTAIYHADADEKTKIALQKQRQQTTTLLQTPYTIELLKHVKTDRDNILHQADQIEEAAETVFKSYNLIIVQLMQKSEDLIFKTQDAQVKNLLIIYHLLKNAQESAGRIRAKIGMALASSVLTDQNRRDIIALDAVYHNLISKSHRHLPSRFRSLIDDFTTTPCVDKTFSYVQYVNDGALQKVSLTPLEWFKLSTCTIEHLDTLSEKKLQLLLSEVSAKKSDAKNSMIKHLLFWGGGFLTLFILLFIVLRHSQALARKRQLLDNYKEAIDYSTIVSKTDKKGYITYVNSAFCDISGYSSDELMNRPHNIVRHPEMPKEVFREMWSTLKKGEKWNGIVKNLKKDGSTYWVDASISPIFDIKGELLEYIAIRRDVTDIILLNEEIRHTQSELIYRMGEAVESRSKESGHHIQRVAHYSKLLAQLADVEHDECEIIFSASTMHDIGKLSIPDDILLKSGELTEQEWKIMRTHAEVGYKILEGSERPLLKMAATVAYEHHEHYDGNGYPRGLKGEEISIYGRIVAVADVFDALATDRIYKKAWLLKDIFGHLKEESGKQFDPELIELVLNNLNLFLEIKNRFQDR